jgi:hypothetical protein
MTFDYLDIASLASRASYSFATAQKSNQTNFAGSKIEQLFYSWPGREKHGTCFVACRPNSFAPRKTFGVPEFSDIANEHILMRHPGAQD